MLNTYSEHWDSFSNWSTSDSSSDSGSDATTLPAENEDCSKGKAWRFPSKPKTMNQAGKWFRRHFTINGMDMDRTNSSVQGEGCTSSGKGSNASADRNNSSEEKTSGLKKIYNFLRRKKPKKKTLINPVTTGVSRRHLPRRSTLPGLVSGYIPVEVLLKQVEDILGSGEEVLKKPWIPDYNLKPIPEDDEWLTGASYDHGSESEDDRPEPKTVVEPIRLPEGSEFETITEQFLYEFFMKEVEKAERRQGGSRKTLFGGSGSASDNKKSEKKSKSSPRKKEETKTPQDTLKKKAAVKRKREPSPDVRSKRPSNGDSSKSQKGKAAPKKEVVSSKEQRISAKQPSKTTVVEEQKSTNINKLDMLKKMRNKSILVKALAEARDEIGQDTTQSQEASDAAEQQQTDGAGRAEEQNEAGRHAGPQEVSSTEPPEVGQSTAPKETGRAVTTWKRLGNKIIISRRWVPTKGDMEKDPAPDPESETSKDNTVLPEVPEIPESPPVDLPKQHSKRGVLQKLRNKLLVSKTHDTDKNDSQPELPEEDSSLGQTVLIGEIAKTSTPDMSTLPRIEDDEEDESGFSMFRKESSDTVGLSAALDNMASSEQDAVPMAEETVPPDLSEMARELSQDSSILPRIDDTANLEKVAVSRTGVDSFEDRAPHDLPKRPLKSIVDLPTLPYIEDDQEDEGGFSMFRKESTVFEIARKPSAKKVRFAETTPDEQAQLDFLRSTGPPNLGLRRMSSTTRSILTRKASPVMSSLLPRIEDESDIGEFSMFRRASIGGEDSMSTLSIAPSVEDSTASLQTIADDGETGPEEAVLSRKAAVLRRKAVPKKELHRNKVSTIVELSGEDEDEQGDEQNSKASKKKTKPTQKFPRTTGTKMKASPTKSPNQKADTKKATSHASPTSAASKQKTGTKEANSSPAYEKCPSYIVEVQGEELVVNVVPEIGRKRLNLKRHCITPVDPAAYEDEHYISAHKRVDVILRAAAFKVGDLLMRGKIKGDKAGWTDVIREDDTRFKRTCERTESFLSVTRSVQQLKDIKKAQQINARTPKASPKLAASKQKAGNKKATAKASPRSATSKQKAGTKGAKSQASPRSATSTPKASTEELPTSTESFTTLADEVCPSYIVEVQGEELVVNVVPEIDKKPLNLKRHCITPEDPDLYEDENFETAHQRVDVTLKAAAVRVGELLMRGKVKGDKAGWSEVIRENDTLFKRTCERNESFLSVTRSVRQLMGIKKAKQSSGRAQVKGTQKRKKPNLDRPPGRGTARQLKGTKQSKKGSSAPQQGKCTHCEKNGWTGSYLDRPPGTASAHSRQNYPRRCPIGSSPWTTWRCPSELHRRPVSPPTLGFFRRCWKRLREKFC